MLADLRTAFRGLAKRPGWAFTVAGTLALGPGGSFAVGSVAYGILLRPLPYPQPDRLVRIYETNRGGGRMNPADPNFAGVGLALAVGLSRLLASLLFGLSVTDLVTFVGVPTLLVAVAAVAVLVPARRAATIEPAAALRSD